MRSDNTRKKMAVAGALLAAAVGTATASAMPAAASQGQATPTASAASASISRATEMQRAKAWINHKSYTYTAGTYPGPGGKGQYRGDCSGFVSMALDLPAPGPNTVGLASEVNHIKASQLKEGDLLGNLGPGTGGESGHVQIFLKWANAQHTKVTVAEQGHISQGGSAPEYPHEKTYTYPEHMSSGATLDPYRYKHIS